MSVSDPSNVAAMREALDRIKEAAERERAALDAARKVAKDTAEQYRKLYEKKKEADNQLAELEERYPIVLEQSNGAAMRAALNQLRDWALLDINENAIRSDEPNYKKLVDGIVEITNAALAAPARNCDRFASIGAAIDGFCREVQDWEDHDGIPEYYELAKWLFASAKEGGRE